MATLRWGEGVVLKQGGAALNGGQRRFELVGNIGDKIATQGFQIAQLFNHLVESAGQKANFVRVVAVQAHLKIAVSNLVDSVHQILQWLKDHFVKNVGEK